MSKALSKEYWNNRYELGDTGWDIGSANHGLVAHVIASYPKSTRILIPGAGKGHEALALWESGFSHTYVCDWAEACFDSLKEAIAGKSLPLTAGELEDRLLICDFFELEMQVDVILEQTFFCALDPTLRESYVNHCYALLQGRGSWVGILFNRNFPTVGPPFGGTVEAYEQLFSKRFEKVSFTPFEHSIAPRKGTEVFGSFACKSMI